MEQINIFEMIFPTYKITKPIRLIELFGGIGSQAKALKNIGADFEHYKLVEFDESAIKSYNAVHGTNYATNDITKISSEMLNIEKTNKFTYLLTYSFPCQDLSIAGKQKGMKRGTSTRSGLLWEVERILDSCNELPQVLLMENVPQVIGKSNIEDFKEWQRKLEKLGYSNYVECLNAKDYGMPQNRNRCFMLSVLGQYNYKFPLKKQLQLRLKDMLETNVKDRDLSNKLKNFFVKNSLDMEKKGNGFRFEPHIQQNAEIARTITTAPGNRMDDNFIISGVDTNKKKLKIDSHNTFILNEEVAIALTENTDKTICLNSKVDGKQPSLQDRIYSAEGISTAITTSFHPYIYAKDLTIRKLTAKECWRLMGFDDSDHEKAREVNSESQLYKQAGNSIVVKVLEEIFKQLL